MVGSDIPPFGTPTFIPIVVLALAGDDHVDVEIAGAVRRLAAGHLPQEARSLLVGRYRTGIHLADSQTRTMLGILHDDAIVDLRDPDPLICPVTLALIRIYAADPRRTLDNYAQTTGMVRNASGSEASCRSDSVITYVAMDRTLTAALEVHGHQFEPHGILVSEGLPSTIRSAGRGRRVNEIVDHAAFHGNDATISSVTEEDGGTRIRWSATALRVHRLPELA